MKVLGCFIAAVAYVALLLWVIDNRNQNVEVPDAQNEVRPQVSRDPGTLRRYIVDRVVTEAQFCAPDYPGRSKLSPSDLDKCDRWESRNRDRANDVAPISHGVARLVLASWGRSKR